ncbi:MAG: histidine phosphatase family protein [Actinobacteria bacterium]|nr:histidine phosphatase family protein [Actinomycetota bacterium]
MPDYDRSPAAGGACTSVLALRHGESEWNAVGRWQGQADPPLTDAGMLQAAAAAKLLGSFDAIFASTLQRAADTAAIIAESLGVGPVQLLDDLQENAFGSWQGLTISEIEAGWPGYLAAHRRPEDAETADAVVARGLRALHTIAALQPRQQALVITHAGLLRTMRRALIQTAGIQTASIPTGPGSDDPALPRFSNLGGCWFHVFTDGTVTVGETVNLIDPQSFGDAF